MFKMDLEKAVEQETKLPTSVGSWKASELQKTMYFCFIAYAKAFEYLETNCGKFFKRWVCQTTLSASWEICVQVKKQQLESDMEQ